MLKRKLPLLVGSFLAVLVIVGAIGAGMDIADVQSAIQTAHKGEMRAQIQQAVEDGTMTQNKADWLLEGLDKGYLDGGSVFGRQNQLRPRKQGAVFCGR